MAKTRKTLIHIHSNVVDPQGDPKQPAPESIEFGELAVNYAAGKEKLFIKNSNNEIVKFMTEGQTSVFAKDPNGFESKLEGLEARVGENEYNTAEQLTTVNDRINSIAARIDEINGKIV